MSNGKDHPSRMTVCRSRRLIGDPVVPCMVKFLVKAGAAKNVGQSYQFLVAFVAVSFAVTAGVFGYYFTDIGDSEPVRYAIPQELQVQMRALDGSPYASTYIHVSAFHD